MCFRESVVPCERVDFPADRMAIVEIEIAMIMNKNPNIKPRMTLLEQRVRSDSWMLRRMNPMHRCQLNKMI